MARPAIRPVAEMRGDESELEREKPRYSKGRSQTVVRSDQGNSEERCGVEQPQEPAGTAICKQCCSSEIPDVRRLPTSHLAA